MVTPVVLPPGVSWGPGPAALPSGARAAVIDGDPTKEQLFTMRLLFPNDYRIPPHSHPAFEHITVISGVLHVGMGNTFNMAGPLDELRAGAFKAISPGMNHFAHAAGETVIQLHGMGPWQVNYVNPADDPRNR
jgi:quercetin dioxygenase-like cupin family protein